MIEHVNVPTDFLMGGDPRFHEGDVVIADSGVTGLVIGHRHRGERFEYLVRPDFAIARWFADDELMGA